MLWFQGWREHNDLQILPSVPVNTYRKCRNKGIAENHVESIIVEIIGIPIRSRSLWRNRRCLKNQLSRFPRFHKWSARRRWASIVVSAREAKSRWKALLRKYRNWCGLSEKQAYIIYMTYILMSWVERIRKSACLPVDAKWLQESQSQSDYLQKHQPIWT